MLKDGAPFSVAAFDAMELNTLFSFMIQVLQHHVPAELLPDPDYLTAIAAPRLRDRRQLHVPYGLPAVPGQQVSHRQSSHIARPSQPRLKCGEARFLAACRRDLSGARKRGRLEDGEPIDWHAADSGAATNRKAAWPSSAHPADSVRLPRSRNERYCERLPWRVRARYDDGRTGLCPMYDVSTTSALRSQTSTS